MNFENLSVSKNGNANYFWIACRDREVHNEERYVVTTLPVSEMRELYEGLKTYFGET